MIKKIYPIIMVITIISFLFCVSSLNKNKTNVFKLKQTIEILRFEDYFEGRKIPIQQIKTQNKIPDSKFHLFIIFNEYNCNHCYWLVIKKITEFCIQKLNKDVDISFIYNSNSFDTKIIAKYQKDKNINILKMCNEIFDDDNIILSFFNPKRTPVIVFTDSNFVSLYAHIPHWKFPNRTNMFFEKITNLINIEDDL